MWRRLSYEEGYLDQRLTWALVDTSAWPLVPEVLLVSYFQQVITNGVCSVVNQLNLLCDRYVTADRKVLMMMMMISADGWHDSDGEQKVDP